MAKYFIALVVVASLWGCSSATQSGPIPEPLKQGTLQLQRATNKAADIAQLASQLTAQPQNIEQFTLELAVLRASLIRLDPLLVISDDPQQRWRRLYYPNANKHYLLPSPEYPYAGIIADRTIALISQSLLDEHQLVMFSDQALGIEAMMIVASSLTPNDALQARKHTYLVSATEQMHTDLAYLSGRWQQLLQRPFDEAFRQQWRAAYQQALDERSLTNNQLGRFLE